MRTVLKSKIHRATVTHADLDYEGSVTISGELLDASGILEHEQVHIWNVTRGTRLVTYALRDAAACRVARDEPGIRSALHFELHLDQTELPPVLASLDARRSVTK